MKIPYLLSVLIAGIIFGFGLSYSSMFKPEVVLSFLRFEDFGLLWVLGSASTITFLTYFFLPRILKKPLFATSFGKHSASLDRDTLIGAAIFGAGWGISGVCPGPAIAGLGVANWPMLVTLVSIFAGAYVQGLVAKKT
ncbi:MAG: putative membrane protein YedE/YeeE [Candidatus Azotimanducaceae bacterium]|jgi:uncharacterized membrane protein YedE/YeeE